MDTVHNAITEPARRLEVFTGAGRRRSFSDEDKARIVAEIVTSGDSVSGVARRHGLSPQQLFGWRRQMRGSQVGLSEADGLQFVPAVVDVASSASTARRQRNVPPCKAEPGAGTIEVEIDGVTIRVGRCADVKTGIELRHGLKAAGVSVPVIYMTASVNPAVRVAALASGCIAFLTKPFSVQELIEPLKKASAGRP